MDTDLVDTTSPVKVGYHRRGRRVTGVQNVNLEIDTSDHPDTGIEAQVYPSMTRTTMSSAPWSSARSGSGDYAYILSKGAISEEKIGDTYY